MLPTVYQKLDSVIADHEGEENLVARIASFAAEGMGPADISAHLGLSKPDLWRWLRDDPQRMAAYLAAKEVVAEECMASVIAIADNATPEDVSVAKLRIETRLKVAERFNKREYSTSGRPVIDITTNVAIGRIEREIIRPDPQPSPCFIVNDQPLPQDQDSGNL